MFYAKFTLLPMTCACMQRAAEESKDMPLVHLPPKEVSLVRPRRGVALVELIITGILFLVVAGVTLGTIARANSTLEASTTANKATELLNRKVAEVRKCSYDAARALSSQTGSEIISPSSGRKVPLRWTRSVSVDETSSTVRIAHRVEWTALGASRQIEAVVLVAPASQGQALAQLSGR